MKKTLFPLLKMLFPLLIDPALLLIASGLVGWEAAVSRFWYLPFWYVVYGSIFFLLLLTQRLLARVYAIKHNYYRKYAFYVILWGISMNLLGVIAFAVIVPHLVK